MGLRERQGRQLDALRLATRDRFGHRQAIGAFRRSRLLQL